MMSLTEKSEVRCTVIKRLILPGVLTMWLHIIAVGKLCSDPLKGHLFRLMTDGFVLL